MAGWKQVINVSYLHWIIIKKTTTQKQQQMGDTLFFDNKLFQVYCCTNFSYFRIEYSEQLA